MPYSINPTHRLLTHNAPVDANAVRELRLGVDRSWSMSRCPNLLPVSAKEIRRRHAHSQFRDLTGLRRGSMVIVGLYEYVEDGASRWVARCDCGLFEFRKHSKWYRNYRKGKADNCMQCGRKLYPDAQLDKTPEERDL